MTAVPTLSLAMIVRNEAATIQRVLGDVAPLCDEMVVVDTGSTDGTPELARSAGARVEHFAWVDDFAAARNVSFGHCTGEWVMWLDADDRVPPESLAGLQQLKGELSDALDQVYLPYRYHYEPDGVTCSLVLPRERLVRRAAPISWRGAVHEVLTADVDGSTLRNRFVESAWVEHRPLPGARESKGDRNLRILERVVSSGSAALRDVFYYGNELDDHGRREEALAAWSRFIGEAPRGWERYTAMTRSASALAVLDRPEEADAMAHRAIREDPTRAEAYVIAGKLHYDRERWAAAAPFFLAATACRRPVEGIVTSVDYGYRPWDFLSICYHRMGDQAKAIDALGRAVAGNPERDRLVDNAGWMIRAWE